MAVALRQAPAGAALQSNVTLGLSSTGIANRSLFQNNPVQVGSVLLTWVTLWPSNSSTAAPTINNGYTLLGSSGTGNNPRTHVFWKVAAATNDGTTTLTAPGGGGVGMNGVWSGGFEFTGADTALAPLHVAGALAPQPSYFTPNSVAVSGRAGYLLHGTGYLTSSQAGDPTPPGDLTVHLRALGEFRWLHVLGRAHSGGSAPSRALESYYMQGEGDSVNLTSVLVQEPNRAPYVPAIML